MAYFLGVGAFEQLFGSGRGEFEHLIVQKFKCPRIAPGGNVKASIWLVHNTREYGNNITLSLSLKLFHYLGEFCKAYNRNKWRGVWK